MAPSEWGGGRRAQGRGAGRRQSKTHRFPDVWSSKHGAAVEFEKGEELKRRKKKKKREGERERKYETRVREAWTRESEGNSSHREMFGWKWGADGL